MTPKEIVVDRAPANASHKTIKHIQRRSAPMIVLAFLLAVALLPLFFYSFWILFEVLVRVFHLPRGTSLMGRVFPQGFAGLSGWPFDFAFVFSTLAAWGILYLAYDRASLFGNQSLQIALRPQAEELLGAPLPASPSTFFVELRPPDNPRRLSDRLRPDMGWLIFQQDKDRVLFIGEYIVVTIPRSYLSDAAHTPRLDTNRFGISPTWVHIPIGDKPNEDLRLLVRDEAARLSDTDRGAQRLLKSLQNFRSSTETA